MRLLALLPLALLAFAAPAAAQQLEAPDRATPIDAIGGTVLFSQRGEDGRFRLAVHPASGARYTLDVPPQSTPFDADLGNDPRRGLLAAYASCPGAASTCDIRVHELGSGRDEAVPGASRPGIGEHAPTVDRGRLAWSVGGGMTGGTARAFVRDLAASGPGRALPVLPRRRCGEDYDGKRFCAAPAGLVSAMELDGDRLVQVVSTFTQRTQARGEEIRLVDVRARRSQQLVGIATGEGGQRFAGPSLANGALYWFLTCFGDPSGCDRNGGVYRYALGGKRLSRALGPRQLSGFAVTARRVYVSEGSERNLCELEQGEYPGLAGSPVPHPIGPCPITAEPLPARWTAYAPRRG